SASNRAWNASTRPFRRMDLSEGPSLVDTRAPPSRPLRRCPGVTTPDRSVCCARGLLLENLPAPVGSAVRAHGVRKPRLVALGALDGLDRFQVEMTAPLALTGLRRPTFW